MLRRLYVHNFRCLENFDLTFNGQSSTLLLGKNGSGKTSVGLALEVLQKIARGTNRIDSVAKPKDFSRGRADVPMRFEIEVELDRKIYAYTIAFEFPEGFKELRVVEEKLVVDGTPIYTRALAQVWLPVRAKVQEKEAKFLIDWHLAALPIIQEYSSADPLFIFKQWLSRVLILRPIPELITGESKDETLEPNIRVTNFGAWFSGLIALSPASYSQIDAYLKHVLTDLKQITNPLVGKDFRTLVAEFKNEYGAVSIPFEDLSDGEKCFMISALVLAANRVYGPLLCFWDEPDNYLAISEVGHFVMELRKAFLEGGQFITTSHNPETIRHFSDESTMVLDRRSHLEPATIRRLSDLQIQGDLVGALIRGDVFS